MRYLNMILFPMMYPIAGLSAILTMLITRATLGPKTWRIPFRWYRGSAYRLTIAIIFGKPEAFYEHPGG